MRKLLVLGCALLAAGCGKAPPPNSPAADTGSLATMSQSSAPAEEVAASTTLQVSAPKLVYRYQLGFVLPGEAIADAQAKHETLCDRLGPRCQILAVERNLGEDQTGVATMKLRVATEQARTFQNALIRVISDKGGRAVNTSVEAEDVSKAMVDAQARIKQRELLVARLTDILRTRDGKVADLVEAERSVAQAQEELDQAKGWLAELRDRVAMSTFDLRYTATAPSSTGSTSQISDAFATSASAFVIGLKTIIVLLILLVPWLLLGVIVFVGVRYTRGRLAKRAEVEPATVD